MLRIIAEAQTAELAYQLAIAYIEELQNYLSQNALTQSKRYRIFLEGQVAKNKRDLLEAGKELNLFYGTSRVSSVESKVTVPLNIDQSQTSALTLSPKSAPSSNANQTTTWQLLQHDEQFIYDVPQQVYLQYLSLQRELLGSLSSLLSQQYEMARMYEAKEDLAFQVVDPPILPYRRYKPRRVVIVIVATGAVTLLSMVVIAATDCRTRLRNKVV